MKASVLRPFGGELGEGGGRCSPSEDAIVALTTMLVDIKVRFFLLAFWVIIHCFKNFIDIPLECKFVLSLTCTDQYLEDCIIF